MGSNRLGLFHLCNTGVCSRLELMQEAAILAGLPTGNLLGKPIVEMGRSGPRPKTVVMELHSLKTSGIFLPRDWKAALAEYVCMHAAKGLDKNCCWQTAG